MEKCEICGKELKTKGALAGHMLSHKKQVNESKNVAAEKIIKPSMVNESKELKEVVTKKEDEFVSVNESKDTDFVQKYKNPYRDLYSDDETTVINEWL